MDSLNGGALPSVGFFDDRLRSHQANTPMMTAAARIPKAIHSHWVLLLVVVWLSFATAAPAAAAATGLTLVVVAAVVVGGGAATVAVVVCVLV